MRISPPTFNRTKGDEDPQSSINEIFKVVDDMGVTPKERAELSAYQLKDAVQVWFEKLREERPLRDGSVDC